MFKTKSITLYYEVSKGRLQIGTQWTPGSKRTLSEKNFNDLTIKLLHKNVSFPVGISVNTLSTMPGTKTGPEPSDCPAVCWRRAVPPAAEGMSKQLWIRADLPPPLPSPPLPTLRNWSEPDAGRLPCACVDQRAA